MRHIILTPNVISLASLVLFEFVSKIVSGYDGWQHDDIVIESLREDFPSLNAMVSQC